MSPVVGYLTPSGAALPVAAGYNVHTHSDFGPWAEDTFRRMLIDRYNVPEAELSQKDLLLVNLWHPFGKAQRSSAGIPGKAPEAERWTTYIAQTTQPSRTRWR